MSLIQLLENSFDDNVAHNLIIHIDKEVILSKNNEHQTALHLASLRGLHNIVNLLLNKEACVNSTDIHGNTPLHLACCNGHSSIVELLLKKEPKVAKKKNNNGDIPLHIACQFGYYDCVLKLLEFDMTTIEITNNNLNTPLFVAIYEKKEDIAMSIINKMPENLDTINNDGNAVIHIAAQEGLLKVIETIINLGYNFEFPNSKGLYPLHIASKYGHVEIVRYLCIAGSDPQRRSVDNIKPEITAIKNNQKEIISILSKLNSNNAKENYIQQLVMSDKVIENTNILLFGNSGTGKSSIIKLLKSGLFSMLMGKSRSTLRTINNNQSFMSQAQNNNGNDISLIDYTSSSSLRYKNGSTKGIIVQKETLSCIGDCTFWDFSGEDTYYNLYHHVIQNTPNKIIVIVYSQSNSFNNNLRSVQFWLSFIQARLPVPNFINKNGFSNYLVPVILVASYSNDKKTSQQSEKNLIAKVKMEYEHIFKIYDQTILFDIFEFDSNSIKSFKEGLRNCKNQMNNELKKKHSVIGGINSISKLNKLFSFTHEGYSLLDELRKKYDNALFSFTNFEEIPRMNGFCEAVLYFLPKLRKIAHPFPVLSWKTFCDTIHLEVNPLATTHYLSILLCQLQNLGEILYLKSELHTDLVVISPSWFGTNIIGTLFSVDFLINQTRMFGSYQVNDFQTMFPHYDAMSVLQLLETMKICVQYDNDGDIEYEFPTYIIREKDETLWKPWHNNNEKCYGGVRFTSQPPFFELLTSIFMKIQVELRYLQNNYYEEMDSFLYQWYGGAIFYVSCIECMVSLEHDNCIEIKIRGPQSSSYTSFYFLEEILHSINLVLIECCPRMKIIKEFLSPLDLSEHNTQPHSYSVHDLFKSIQNQSKLKSTVIHPLANIKECVLDVLAFGCDRVIDKLLCSSELPLTELSMLCRQELSQLLDEVHPLGKDWALFALNIGLDSKVQLLDDEQTSPFLKLIDLWATSQPATTIGMLIDGLNEIEREDAASVILQHVQCYRIKSMDNKFSLIDNN